MEHGQLEKLTVSGASRAATKTPTAKGPAGQCEGLAVRRAARPSLVALSAAWQAQRRALAAGHGHGHVEEAFALVDGPEVVGED